MSLLIKGGEIVTGDEHFIGDIYCEHERITHIDRNIDAPSGAEVINASGKYVFPGFIDPHVHIYLPFMGTFSKDTYETASKAALVGGTTTLIEMVCPSRDMSAAEGFRLWQEQHHESRPPRVEAEGVHHLMTFAELTGAHVYIVHLSCDEALREALAARHRGVNVSIEKLIQYLVLDKTDAERPEFEGAKFVMSPPLRDKSNQPVLWNGLSSGEIQTVATDHAPFDFKTQKPMGRDDFTKIPNGIPSLEDRVNLLFTHGVKTGKLDLHTFVNVASMNAAKTFGLFPRKGAIQIGADADLVIYDPEYRGRISAKTQLMNVDYSAFEGWEIEGRPDLVTVRGEVAVRDGEFVGTIGHGRMLKREPTHFT